MRFAVSLHTIGRAYMVSTFPDDGDSRFAPRCLLETQTEPMLRMSAGAGVRRRPCAFRWRALRGSAGGSRSICTTDTIDHATNRISLAEKIVHAIQGWAATPAN